MFDLEYKKKKSSSCVAKVLHLDDASLHPLRFLFANFQGVGRLDIFLKGR